MESLFVRVLTLSLTGSAVLLPLLLLAPRLRGRYAAGTLSVLWLVLALRMALPVPLSLPFPFPRSFPPAFFCPICLLSYLSPFRAYPSRFRLLSLSFPRFFIPHFPRRPCATFRFH